MMTAAMPDLSEFMTTRQAARRLRFHIRSIPYMIKNRTLQGVRVGRQWLITEKSVEDYLEKTRGLPKHDPRRKLGH